MNNNCMNSNNLKYLAVMVILKSLFNRSEITVNVWLYLRPLMQALLLCLCAFYQSSPLQRTVNPL